MDIVKLEIIGMVESEFLTNSVIKEQPFKSNEEAEILARPELELMERINKISQALNSITILYSERYTEGQLNLFPKSLKEQEMNQAELQRQFPRRYALYEAINSSGIDLNNQAEDIGLDIHTFFEANEESFEQIADWLKMMNSVDTYMQVESEKMRRWLEAGKPELAEYKPTLKEKQLDVFDSIRRSMEQDVTEGYVKLPTSVGKTAVFAEWIEASDATEVIIVVPTVDLVDQTYEALQYFAEGVEAAKISGRSKGSSAKVKIYTIDKLMIDLVGRALDPEQVQMLILDEAHRYLTNSRKEAVRRFTNAVKIGFTATPEFSQSKQVHKLLPHEFYRMSIEDAIMNGLVSSYQNFLVEADVDLSALELDDETVQMLQESEDTKEPSATSKRNRFDKELEKRMNEETVNQQALDTYLAIGNNETAAVNCTSIAHAEKVADKFTSNGHNAEVIHGGLTADQRKEMIKRVNDGTTTILCGDQLLIEGLNIPRIGIVLNLAPTWSRVVAEQRGGRGLRLYPDIPVKRIVDFLPKKYPSGQRPLLFADITKKAKIVSPVVAASAASTRQPDEQDVPTDPLVYSPKGLAIITDPRLVEEMLNTDENDETLNKIEKGNGELWKAMQRNRTRMTGSKLTDLTHSRVDIVKVVQAITSDVQGSKKDKKKTTKRLNVTEFDLNKAKEGTIDRQYSIEMVRLVIRSVTGKFIYDNLIDQSNKPNKDLFDQVLMELEEGGNEGKDDPARAKKTSLNQGFYSFAEKLFYLQMKKKYAETLLVDDKKKIVQSITEDLEKDTFILKLREELQKLREALPYK